MKNNLKPFEGYKWTQAWAGSWSLLTCSEFGELYAHSLGVNGKLIAPTVIFILSHGKCACLIRQSDRISFGEHLVAEVVANPSRVQEIADNLKEKADVAIEFMEQHRIGDITLEIYSEFWRLILEKYKPHINVKYIVDYLEPDLLEQYLPILEEARVHAEPVFEHSEEFMESTAAQISAKVNIETKYILSMLRVELEQYFSSGDVPSQDILQKRYERSALLVSPSSGAFLRVGDEVDAVEEITAPSQNTDELHGKSAYMGVVTGNVRIVFDPMKITDFSEGDILVTGMTRPEFLPLMKKSGAVVTDSGGVLSHAAITAREIKKPTVIGTEIATKVLKDGDKVEVDANEGVIRKIK